jgi:hypothetical protein
MDEALKGRARGKGQRVMFEHHTISIFPSRGSEEQGLAQPMPHPQWVASPADESMLMSLIGDYTFVFMMVHRLDAALLLEGPARDKGQRVMF